MVRILLLLTALVLGWSGPVQAKGMNPVEFNMPWLKKKKALKRRKAYRKKKYAKKRSAYKKRSRKSKKARLASKRKRVKSKKIRVSKKLRRSKKTRLAKKKRVRIKKKSTQVAAKKEKWVGGPRPSISAKKPPVVRLAGFGKGRIIIDTAKRQLFYTLGGGKAYRYPVAVGRQGFQWFGTKKITRKASWPDWRPPAEMRERNPKLPKIMTGGNLQSARCEGALSWFIALSHPRYCECQKHRHSGFVRLFPHAQQSRCALVADRWRWHARHRRKVAAENATQAQQPAREALKIRSGFRCLLRKT